MKKMFTLFVSAVLLLALTACANVSFFGQSDGPSQQMSHTVALDDAEMVEAQVQMKAGTLEISGGGPDLMDGTFVYNRENLRPEISYTNRGGAGELNISSETNFDLNTNSAGNTWMLRLNETMPLRLHVSQGAGNVNLNLGDLNLSYLEVEIGAGNQTIDLRGDWAQNVDVVISAGIGDLTILVPETMGAYVTVNDLLGSVSASGLKTWGTAYVNNAYGSSPHTLKISIDSAVGEVTLRTAEASR